MKHKTVITIFLIAIISLNGTTSSGNVSQELEWHVKVGDSHEYIFSKYYYDYPDGDGDPSTTTMEIKDEEGDWINITLTKGSKLKFEITALNGVATLKTTYNGEVTDQEHIDAAPPGSIVAKTVDDRTYWESWVENKTDYSLEGDLLVISHEQIMIENTQETILKRNWKTGWLRYVYTKISNKTATIIEFEYSSNGNGEIQVTSFPFIPLLISMTVIVIVLRKQRSH
ncbi:MAG: hypothetical protein JSV04_06290 [Candidatus Heimdallarchaeota archaeon]|nr:MAG: hypothetical protein JSV04_06290 [Candidatus Heimdallarchaeota archaeon]